MNHELGLAQPFLPVHVVTASITDLLGMPTESRCEACALNVDSHVPSSKFFCCLGLTCVNWHLFKADRHTGIT